jgi:hypothetical protein
MAVANRLQDAPTKANVLQSIALTYASQQPDKALQIASSIEPLDSNLANQARASIASEYARREQFDRALQVVELIKDNNLAKQTGRGLRSLPSH